MSESNPSTEIPGPERFIDEATYENERALRQGPSALQNGRGYVLRLKTFGSDTNLFASDLYVHVIDTSTETGTAIFSTPESHGKLGFMMKGEFNDDRYIVRATDTNEEWGYVFDIQEGGHNNETSGDWDAALKKLTKLALV